MGGFNDCPDSQSQCVICKEWYEKYGAYPSVVTEDIREFSLPDGAVADKEEAKKLALEQYLFCPDRVEQSMADSTLGNLVDSLMQSTKWYFWWD